MELRGFETAAALGRAAGIPNSTITRWITGDTTKITVEKLRLLVKPLGVPLIVLIVKAGLFDPTELELSPSLTLGPVNQLRDARQFIKETDRYTNHQKTMYLSMLDELHAAMAQQAPPARPERGRKRGKQ